MSKLSDMGDLRDAIVLMVEGNEYRRIEVPALLKDDLVFLAIKKLVGSYYLYKIWSLSKYKSMFVALRYFCDCFGKSENLISERGEFLLSRRSGRIFVDYLVSVGHSESTIYNHSESIRVLLKHTMSAEFVDFLGTTAREWNRTKQIINDWPKINKKAVYKSRPGLAEKFEVDCSEQQILISIKLFCPWFLSECNRIRKEFKEKCEKDYEWLLEQAKKPDSRRVLERAAVASGSCKTLIGKAYEVILRSARVIESPLFYEAVLFKGVLLDSPVIEVNNKSLIFEGVYMKFPDPNIDYGSWGKDEIIENLEAFQGKFGVSRRKLKSKKFKYFSMRSLFSPMFLLVPSVEEKMVISWLLAADRVQYSNLSRIRMRDVSKINSTISVSSYKGRNSSTAAVHFRRGDPAYDSINDYKNSMEYGYDNGIINTEGVVEDSKFIPGLKDSIFFLKTHSTTCSILLPLVFNGSKSQEKYLKYCSGLITSASPFHFLSCLSSAFECNTAFSKKRNEIRYLERRRNGVSVAHSNDRCRGEENKIMNVGSRSLGPQTVAQTCVLGNDSARALDAFERLLVNDKMLVNLYDEHDIESRIHAEGMRHSLSSENMYADFSRCKQKLDVDKKFGDLVGSEMCSIASEMAKFLIDKACIVSLKQIDGILKISGGDVSGVVDERQVLECAHLQDYVVDKVGLFEKDGLTYVVKTPLVAALIKAKADHIESNLLGFLNDSPLQVKKLLSLLVFYRALLNEFEPDLLRRADDEYGKYEMNFSDINI